MTDHVDLIREAARLMRQRAEAATEGPWLPTDRYPHIVFQCGEEYIVSTNLASNPLPDAEHIASWHPGVALVVADWLDIHAGDLERASGYVGACDSPADVMRSLAVARAYLGKESP